VKPCELRFKLPLEEYIGLVLQAHTWEATGWSNHAHLFEPNSQNPYSIGHEEQVAEVLSAAFLSIW
jgi:hypothetical protein